MSDVSALVREVRTLIQTLALCKAYDVAKPFTCAACGAPATRQNGDPRFYCDDHGTDTLHDRFRDLDSAPAIRHLVVLAGARARFAVQDERRRDGMIAVDGTPHLRDCAKVAIGGDNCSCGSEP